MLKNFSINARVEWKLDNTPLTETDTAINQLVIEKIQLTFPSDGVLSEEGSFEKIEVGAGFVIQ